MRLIDADALIDVMVKDIAHWSTKTLGEALSIVPTVDAVPIEKVAYLFAKYFDSPCNFSPLDEEMSEVCGENCDMDDVKCWTRWIKLKMDGDAKEGDGE